MNKDLISKNLIISPFCIFQVLSLGANGAKKDTLKEMLSLLNSEDLSSLNNINFDLLEKFKDFSTVEVANGIMLRRFTPAENFVEISEKYLAPICELKNVKQVNDWVNEKTHGKISEIISKLDDEILFILLNAVYFKGEWSQKFNRGMTKPKSFYNTGKPENEIQVDMMSKLSRFYYYENEDFQAIDLPYTKDGMSALIILPTKKIDINEFIEDLKNGTIDYNKDIIKKLEYKKVDLELPKFETNFSQNLNDILKKMGMNKAFVSGQADFTGIIEERDDVYISEVIHKTYLNVNEEQTEASAVGAGGGGGGSGSSNFEEIYEMKVNRPFLFWIRSKLLPIEYDLLFMAKIEELKEKK